MVTMVQIIQVVCCSGGSREYVEDGEVTFMNLKRGHRSRVRSLDYVALAAPSE